MKFYYDFNAMFNAQSGLKKDISVFNGIDDVFVGTVGKAIKPSDYPELEFQCEDHLCHWAVYPTSSNIRKIAYVYDAFCKDGRVKDFEKLFPIFGDLLSDADATITSLENGDRTHCPVLCIDDGYETYDGEDVIYSGFRYGYGMPNRLHELEIQVEIPRPAGYSLQPGPYDDEMIDYVNKSGFLVELKKQINMFQDEVVRIVGLYPKQYDLTNPIKEKFWMPVD